MMIFAMALIKETKEQILLNVHLFLVSLLMASIVTTK
jgi:hypothetical protein